MATVSIPSAQPSDTDVLQQRIAELEHSLREQARSSADQRAEIELLQTVVNHIPYALYWKDPYLVYRGCNMRFASDLGLASTDEIVGRTDADLPWQDGEVAAFEAIDRRVLAGAAPEYDDQETVVYPNGVQEWFETYKIPLHNPSGAVVGLLATYNNITARKQAEATVMAQATLLQEISTPVIPLTDQILVLPLVGAIDTHRAQQVLSTVLERLRTSGAQIVLLDITGVPIIDTQVAHTLIRTGQAVQLLGAQMILTGIRPEIAQALVGLGVELTSMVTYGTLQSGLADVLKRRGAQLEARTRR